MQVKLVGILNITPYSSCDGGDLTLRKQLYGKQKSYLPMKTPASALYPPMQNIYVPTIFFGHSDLIKDL